MFFFPFAPDLDRGVRAVEMGFGNELCVGFD